MLHYSISCNNTIPAILMVDSKYKEINFAIIILVFEVQMFSNCVVIVTSCSSTDQYDTCYTKTGFKIRLNMKSIFLGKTSY